MNIHGFRKDELSKWKETDEDLELQMPFEQQDDLSMASSLLLNLQDSLGLRASRNPRPLQTLLLDLFSEEWQVRVEAIHGLELQSEPVPLRVLLIALGDENAFVRAAAARVIGSLEVGELKDSLLAALSDEDKYVRAAATQALGTFPINVPKEVFVEQLQDKESIVRTAAIAAIGKRRERASLPLLSHVLNVETDEMVRREAIEACHQLGVSSLTDDVVWDEWLKDAEDGWRVATDLTQEEPFKKGDMIQQTGSGGEQSCLHPGGVAPFPNVRLNLTSAFHQCPYCVPLPDEVSLQINQWCLGNGWNFLHGPEPLEDPLSIDLLIYSLYKFFENRERVFIRQASIERNIAVVLSNSYPNEAGAIGDNASVKEIVRRTIKSTASVAPLCAALNETDETIRKVAEKVRKKIDHRPWSEVLLISGEMQPLANQSSEASNNDSRRIIFCSISYPTIEEGGRRVIDAPILDELLNIQQSKEQKGNHRLYPQLSSVKIWYEAANPY